MDRGKDRTDRRNPRWTGKDWTDRRIPGWTW